MLEWEVVQTGDIIVPKGRNVEAKLLSNGNVEVEGEEKSIQAWLEFVYGWASVQTYRFAIHKEMGKSLSQIRQDYMETNNQKIDLIMK